MGDTYVEDRLVEGVRQRLPEELSHPENFLVAKMEEELKKFNSPGTDKARKLFVDYLVIDITAEWNWNGVDVPKAREKLGALVRKTEDAVHRSKVSAIGTSARHLVTKDDFAKAIRFLKELGASMTRLPSLKRQRESSDDRQCRGRTAFNVLLSSCTKTPEGEYQQMSCAVTGFDERTLSYIFELEFGVSAVRMARRPSAGTDSQRVDVG